MSKVIIWIHAVWSTKNRYPYFNRDFLDSVREHISGISFSKGIPIEAIGGSSDHLHALIRLPADMSIGKVMQQIKGESSHWINSRKLLPLSFSWGVDYYAESVSQREVHRVKKYILNQELHHDGKSSFEEEMVSLFRPDGLFQDEKEGCKAEG